MESYTSWHTRVKLLHEWKEMWFEEISIEYSIVSFFFFFFLSESNLRFLNFYNLELYVLECYVFFFFISYPIFIVEHKTQVSQVKL